MFFFPTGPEEGVEPKGTVVGTALARTSGESWLIKDQGRNDPQEGDTKGRVLSGDRRESGGATG